VSASKDGPSAGPRSKLGEAAPWALLVVLSVLHRLPSLLNANATNSDAAICGLQAMHVLKGEWSPFLYGSGYQTSVDSTVAAAFFAVLGATPFALMFSTFVGHVALTLFAFSTVKRRVSTSLAFVLSLLLVFTAGPIHTYVLYPPRQASLTLAIAAWWAIDRAPSSLRPRLALAVGAFLAGVSVFADPYALLFLPGTLLLAFFVCLDAKKTALPRALALALGFAIGITPYLILRRLPGASLGQTSLSLEALDRHVKLLFESGLPWALSYRFYAAKVMSDYQPWDMPGWFSVVQRLGAMTIVALILTGFALFFTRSIAWSARRLGVAAALLFPATIGGFLVSPMVMDHFSSRYLVAFLLVAPFALAPVALLTKERMGERRAAIWIAAMLAPYLVSSAVAGWVSYRPFTNGASISLEPGRIRDERAVQALLQEHKIRYAAADYWASYRLTLAYAENPIVVPTNPAEDRYAPYRRAWEAEPRVAYLYDALRSREKLADVEADIAAGRTPYAPGYERLVIGAYTILLLDRAKPL
jgi:hypothetical protein